MWLITTIGFFSVVQKPDDIEADTLTVRARVKYDLQRLSAYVDFETPIAVNYVTDYRYRVKVKRELFAEAMSKLVKDIDYDNFKDAVKDEQGHYRAHVYSDVWAALYPMTSHEEKMR